MERMTMLGKRLICDECGHKADDLKRDPPQCPKCASTQIRKKPLKTAITAPVNISVEDEEELVKDDLDLEPLDDLDLGTDSDDDDSEDGPEAFDGPDED